MSQESRFAATFRMIFVGSLHLVYNCLQHLKWRVDGTYKQLCKSRKPENYSESAHVLNVKYRYIWTDLMVHGKLNFVTTHHQFMHPSYVLADHVSLYDVTHTEAVFVETEPSVNVYNSETAVFLRHAQYLNAKRIVVMPIAAFHKLAEEVGNPKATVFLLSHVGRTGSTLLAQVFESTGICRSLSEPQTFFSANFMRLQMNEEDYERLVVNTLRMHCKPAEGYSIFFLKNSNYNMEIVPIFMRHIPEMKHMYLYRDTWDTLRSGLKIVNMAEWEAKIMLFLFKLSPRMQNVFRAMAVGSLPPENLDRVISYLTTREAALSHLFVIPSAFYLKFQKQGLPIPGIRYEEMERSPRKAMEIIFKYCGLPTHLVERGLEAMKKDSQRGSAMAKRKTQARRYTIEYTGKTKEIIDYIYNQYEVPTPEFKGNYPGTIEIPPE